MIEYVSNRKSTKKRIMTEHEKILLRTSVDYRDVDFTTNNNDVGSIAAHVVDAIAEDMLKYGRLQTLFEQTKTGECRQLIAEQYGYFIKSVMKELPLPFANIKYKNTCHDTQYWDFNNLPKGVHMGVRILVAFCCCCCCCCCLNKYFFSSLTIFVVLSFLSKQIIQNRTYQLPTEEDESYKQLYISPMDIVLCYGILAHDNANATIRLIEALDEPTTWFVVHVDAKNDETYKQMKEYSMNRSRVVILDDPYRVRVNWGGFSMVNATLQILNYADKHHIDFTHFVHMASTAYPVASNRRIRNTLAAHPKDANFLHVILRPVRPNPMVWNYFVECDDKLHRIHRMPVLMNDTHGVDLYTASQWFIISKEYAHFLANPEDDESLFLPEYLEYIKHTVVADEHFFGTVLRNTKFCNKVRVCLLFSTAQITFYIMSYSQCVLLVLPITASQLEFSTFTIR